MKTTLLYSSLLASLFSTQAKAMLYIDDLEITSTNINFVLTGSVEIVGSDDLSALFFGFVGSDTWIASSPVSATGFSNGGDYEFNSAGGANNTQWGDYLFTAGSDTLVVGDVIDLSYTADGAFDLTGLNILDFTVQAGSAGTFDDFIQPQLVAGGVRSLAQVPEPSSLALIGLGLAGLGLARRRTKT